MVVGVADVVVPVMPDIIDWTVDDAEFWQVRRFCSAVLTSAFCARVSVSSLAWAFLIAVSVDFWSRSFCLRAVLSVSFAASTDCWAWVMASASCCRLMSVGPACAWASAAWALAS